jgi:hypothetical protein
VLAVHARLVEARQRQRRILPMQRRQYKQSERTQSDDRCTKDAIVMRGG